MLSSPNILKRPTAHSVHAPKQGHQTTSNDVSRGTLDVFTPPAPPHETKSGAVIYDTGSDILHLGTGDSTLKLGIIPDAIGGDSSVFDKLKEEVKWNKMYHRGGEVPRLVAVQGIVEEDGSFPIYRHPADESPPLLPFSPTVLMIHKYVEAALNHPINHVLIQHYRSGNDYISDHSDKTIDIVRGSKIVNVSLGSERTMTLRLKRDNNDSSESVIGTVNGQKVYTPRPAQKFLLPHNSMFVMGAETNKRYLHGISRDKRLTPELSDRGRISLTFRYIGTFLSPSPSGLKIWGQGATGKTREEAHDVISGEQASAGLIEMFGRENAESSFPWEEVYGPGSDVLHFILK